MIENNKNTKKTTISRVCIFALMALAGCSYNVKDFNSVPDFSPVRADLGYEKSSEAVVFQKKPKESNYSLFRSNGQSFYRDPRAMKPGDVLTVEISINDKANLKNNTEITRENSAEYSIGATYSLIGKNAGNINGASNSDSSGDGQITRNETIELSVAAVVTNVLPNGNLIINGSQEVRVNYELRVLNIAGIVRPRDITGNNKIEYDKIAEARISYGGRGRMSEVQQPPYGQQLLNQLSPF